jgi:hypothetical protein
VSNVCECPTCGAHAKSPGIGQDSTPRVISTSRQPLSTDPRIVKDRLRAAELRAKNARRSLR